MAFKIKTLRKAKKISRELLDELSGVHACTIATIEKGKANPHVLTLKAIADALQVDVKDLL